MPVIPRDSSSPPCHTANQNSLEDVLRDAAAFAEKEKVSEGLAHRALARQIALQAIREQHKTAKTGPRSRVLYWLGGLSAGTIAGASAAVLLMAHLSANSLTSSAALSEVISAPATAAPEIVAPRLKPWQNTPIKKKPLVSPASVSQKTMMTRSEPPAPSMPIRQSLKSPKRTRSVQAFSTRPHHSERKPQIPFDEPSQQVPKVSAGSSDTVHWKSEPVEETSYQLVTTAYVASPETADIYGRGIRRLTPVRMCVSLESVAAADDPLFTDGK